MTIRIVNLKTYKPVPFEYLIRVDRANKILGNPFYMSGEHQRDEVCDKYEVYIKEKILSGDVATHQEFRKIKEISKIKDVALGCHCTPKRCHAETILRLLNAMD